MGEPGARCGSRAGNVPGSKAVENETGPASDSAWAVWMSDCTYGGRRRASRYGDLASIRSTPAYVRWPSMACGMSRKAPAQVTTPPRRTSRNGTVNCSAACQRPMAALPMKAVGLECACISSPPAANGSTTSVVPTPSTVTMKTMSDVSSAGRLF